MNVLSVFGGLKKGSNVFFRDFVIIRVFQDFFGGNVVIFMFVVVLFVDKVYKESLIILQYVFYVKSVKNYVKVNMDEIVEIIVDFRDEILKLRDKIVLMFILSRDDVQKFEDFV